MYLIVSFIYMYLFFNYKYYLLILETQDFFLLYIDFFTTINDVWIAFVFLFLNKNKRIIFFNNNNLFLRSHSKNVELFVYILYFTFFNLFIHFKFL